SGPSKATFKVMTTCIPKDTDSDTVPDQLDSDTENDGIPDLFESQGLSANPLSNQDDNSDGLDNIFGNGIAAADNDNDNIPNYLDLDSDNDGIFDLYESSSNAPDSNGNGIIDGGPSSFGGNGLANATETFTDSGVLSYTIADSDSDGNTNYVETDSDNDGCNDVNEAGFADPNADGYLGSGNPPVVNSSGMVTGGTSGYSTPNPAYAVATPIIITTQPQGSITCEMQNASITIVADPGATYQWQVATNGVNFVNIVNNSTYSGSQTPTLNVNGVTPAMTGYQYRVVLNLTGNICGLISDTATLTINPLPPVVSKTLVQCDTGASPNGITIFNLSEADGLITNNDANLTPVYFLNQSDAETNLNPLPLIFPNTSNPQAIKVRITDNTTGCFSISTLNLSVNTVPNGIVSLPQQCDTDGSEDGFFVFDLTSANIPVGPQQTIRYFETQNDALLEQSQIQNPNTYVNNAPYTLQTLYARVENSLGCSGITEINIKVNPLPDIDINENLDNHLVCVNTSSFSTTLDAAILDGSSPSDYTYQWAFEGGIIPGANSPTLTVDTEGTYTVEVTNSFGCSKLRTIPVLASSTAIIDDIIIVDLVENNTVTVLLSSNSYGDYVYSIDYQNAYQASNVLENVPPGIHIVYVKDLNGCPIASQEIAVLGIPPYFTPNGDGYHDTWNVKGISDRYYPDTTVHIFDRYGKLLKQIGAAGNGWDGTYNGAQLPSSDYWYVVKFGNGTIVKGHFAMKR
ncbi:MAG TPA: T9SS type B sorting domain-containing protein, partial [Flavobacterium sp.]